MGEHVIHSFVMVDSNKSQLWMACGRETIATIELDYEASPLQNPDDWARSVLAAHVCEVEDDALGNKRNIFEEDKNFHFQDESGTRTIPVTHDQRVVGRVTDMEETDQGLAVTMDIDAETLDKISPVVNPGDYSVKEPDDGDD